MNKEFIPYEQALALKELGFDEPSFKAYDSKGVLQKCTSDYWDISSLNRINEATTSNLKVLAPTFSQCFKFFREKYSLVHEISWSKYKGGSEFDYDIFSLVLPTDDELGDEDDIASDKSMETYDSLVEKDFKHKSSETYEEAELACLIKLIEICKKIT